MKLAIVLCVVFLLGCGEKDSSEKSEISVSNGIGGMPVYGNEIVQKYPSQRENVKALVRQFHKDDTKNGCAAYASAALQLFGHDVDKVVVTNELVAEIKKLKHSKVSLDALQPGDIIFTTKIGSNLIGTHSHVYIHGGYVDSVRRTHSLAIDNIDVLYKRELYGSKAYDKAVLAYRLIPSR